MTGWVARSGPAPDAIGPRSPHYPHPVIATPLLAAHIRVSALLASATPDPSTTASPITSASATPSPEPSGSSLAEGFQNALSSAVSQAQAQSCTRDDFSICGISLRITGSTQVGQWLEVLLGIPLQVAFTLALGWAARKLAHRLIGRLADRIASGGTAVGRTGPGETADDSEHTHTGGEPDEGAQATRPPLALPPLPGDSRRQARSRTLAQLLRNITTVLIVIVVGLMVLEEVGQQITPLLASLSVIGVALGLGAQGVVRDVLAGMFMILEDQYGVGDSVNVGQASGVVEAVGLRVTQLRDLNGTVWYVRNGEILSVGNSSQGWSRAVLDINVGFEEDIDRVEDLLEEISGRLYAEPAYRSRIIEAPEVWGVESVTQDSVVVRMVVKTLPNQSAPIARELRRRIRVRFAREGVYMHSSTRTMIVDRGQATPPSSSTAAPGTAAPPTSAQNPTGTDTASQRHPEEREFES